VIERLGRRALELVVLLFALLGFAFVPLGHKTGLEHVGAILSTDAARQAGRDLLQAMNRLRSRLGWPPGPKPANARRLPEHPLPFGQTGRRNRAAPLHAVSVERPDAGPDASVAGS
jgi:hypothetical protein